MYKLRWQDGQLLFTIALVLHVLFTVVSATYDLKDFFEQSRVLTLVRATVFGLLIAKIALDGLKFSLWQIVTVALVVLQALISHGHSLLYIYSPWLREMWTSVTSARFSLSL